MKFAKEVKSDLEVVKRLYAAVAAGDMSAISDCIHPEIVVVEAKGLP